MSLGMSFPPEFNLQIDIQNYLTPLSMNSLVLPMVQKIIGRVLGIELFLCFPLFRKRKFPYPIIFLFIPGHILRQRKGVERALTKAKYLGNSILTS